MKLKKERSMLSLHAKNRKSGGPMKLKKNKRINNKNKQQEYLNEDH